METNPRYMTPDELAAYNARISEQLFAEEKVRQDREMEVEKGRLRGAYIKAGGDAATFDERWPSLKHDIVAKRVSDQHERIREQGLRHAARNF